MEILKLIKSEMKHCGKSRYCIAKDTGIDAAALCRISQGGDCKTRTVEILLKYFGYEIKKKKG